MKTAPLTLLLAWAVQAHADTTLPTTATGKRVSWADSCAARIDAAAKALGFKPGARVSPIPLRHEDGKPNPVQYVYYAADYFTATAGEDSEQRPDAPWKLKQTDIDRIEGSSSTESTWFRRLHNHFAKLEGSLRKPVEHQFLIALDECLQMGELK